MKHALRVVAALIVIAALATWLGTGANRGWSKTSREVKTIDEITGIEGIEYKKAFVPGIDFMGSALLVAGALAAVSFFVRNKQK